MRPCSLGVVLAPHLARRSGASWSVAITVVGPLLASVALIGCASTGTMPKANVESTMLTQMNVALQGEGLTASAVTCPGDLEQKVAATMIREITYGNADETRTGVVAVRVESVDDGGAYLGG